MLLVGLRLRHGGLLIRPWRNQLKIHFSQNYVRTKNLASDGAHWQRNTDCLTHTLGRIMTLDQSRFGRAVVCNASKNLYLTRFDAFGAAELANGIEPVARID